MLDIEVPQSVIDAHRQTLRRLYSPLPAGMHLPTARQRFGAFLVSLGERIGNLRDEVAAEAPAFPPTLRRA